MTVTGTVSIMRTGPMRDFEALIGSISYWLYHLIEPCSSTVWGICFGKVRRWKQMKIIGSSEDEQVRAMSCATCWEIESSVSPADLRHQPLTFLTIALRP